MLNSLKIKPIERLIGAFNVPGDKSISHRAIILNSIAEGKAEITNVLMGADCLKTIDCMRKLGVQIEIDGTTLRITGKKKLKNNQTLNVGNSATTMRLLAGLLCGRGLNAVLDGDNSIRTRPMERIIEPLTQMGAKITGFEGHAPLTIKAVPFLNGIDYTLPVHSAQLKSALLLAGLSAKSPTTVRETVLTRNHTEIMLENQSASIRLDPLAATVSKSALKSLNISVPGDISSAVYLIVLATVLPASNILIKNVGINPTRRAVIDLINSLGGRIALLNIRSSEGEPAADIMVQSAKTLRPFSLSDSQIPALIDELPVLTVLAAMIDGESTVSDAGELRAKESDRINSMAEVLSALNVRVKTSSDGMTISGTGVIMGGATVDPKGDHRVAMSAAVAMALSLDGGDILSPSVADISYPGFFDIFK
jgi:3-phosphoshikimate 1-carboxyvinyltransferase